MILYQELLALLTNATDAADRIYPNIAPDTPGRPYIVYTRVSAADNNNLQGNSGLINTRLQLDVYADTYVAVQALANQVDDLMNGWTLKNISYPAIDQYEPDVRLHRVILDYSVWHN